MSQDTSHKYSIKETEERSNGISCQSQFFMCC